MPQPRKQPPVETCEDAPPTAALVERVRSAWRDGRTLALPGDTAYLLVARADAPRFEDRSTRTYPVRLFGGVEEFEQVLARSTWPLAPLALRVARRHWPGPLVIELEGSDESAPAITRSGRTRFLTVAHAVTAALASAAAMPLAAVEARSADGTLLLEARDVAAHAGDVELVVDGGRARLGEPAAILSLGRGRFELVEEGLFGLDALRQSAGLSIGFVCSGNTCRSPMAEAIARAELTRRLGSARLADFGFHVVSAGVGAAIGAPAATHAVDILASRRIDLSGHRSRPAIPEDIARLDRVFGLTRAHVEALAMGLPPGRATHVELLDPEGRDVPDPFGGSRADYERCAARLEEAIVRRAAEWA